MIVTIQIGNSDDKLSQEDWANYIKTCGEQINYYADEVYFSGGSSPEAPWQNYCWVAQVIGNYNLLKLRNELITIRAKFGQYSIAWTEGQTDFI